MMLMKNRLVLVAILVVVIAAAALLIVTPYLLSGSWSVKMNTITFSENIDTSLRPQVSFGTATEYYWVITSADYYYTIHSGGSISTINNSLKSKAGNFTGFISWFLVNPSNQTISQGNYTISSGFGNRTHTFTFSADQGVRDSGIYRLNLLLSGSAKAAGASPVTVASVQRYSWNVP
jgi:hypothetical protein